MPVLLLIRTFGASGFLPHLKSTRCRKGARVCTQPDGKPSHEDMIHHLSQYHGRSTRKRHGTASAGSVTKQRRLSFQPNLTTKAADELVLRALVVTASPLSLLDNTHFAAMIQGLRLGVHPRGSQTLYNPPTRQCASGSLLNSVYEAEKTTRRKEVFVNVKDTGVTTGKHRRPRRRRC